MAIPSDYRCRKPLVLLAAALVGAACAAIACNRKPASFESNVSPQVAYEPPSGRITGDLPEPVEPRIESRHAIEGLPTKIAQFESVFWEPDDTISLRGLIRETPLVEGKTVLEIGTGTGLVSLFCLERGAQRVVATDINPAAVANATYNASLVSGGARFEARLVPLEQSDAFAVVADDERFDLIVSNPPWEDDEPQSIADFALYDNDFALLKSIIAGLDDHLAPGGKAMLAYGCKTAVEKVIELAGEHDLQAEILDDRELETLPEVFLPGMLIELRRTD